MDKETVGNCMGGELWEQYFYEARFTWVWIVYVYSCLYGIVCLQEKRQYQFCIFILMSCATFFLRGDELKQEIYLLYLYDLPGMTQLTSKNPDSTQANFKGFPGTNGLASPLKDAKENLLLNF